MSGLQDATWEQLGGGSSARTLLLRNIDEKMGGQAVSTQVLGDLQIEKRRDEPHDRRSRSDGVALLV
jgi:hypothetical protein